MSVRRPQDAAGEAFWDEFWNDRRDEGMGGYVPPAFEAWGRYVSSAAGGRCLEVGCYPGRNLVYLHEALGCFPVGVDYTRHLDNVRDLMAARGIEAFELYRSDFLELPTTVQADLVLSVGFVEHFHNYREIIRKHVGHAADGGWIVIVIPNFRYAQRVLHNLWDREVLAAHVLESMDPALLADALSAAGAEVVESTYWGTYDWWCETRPSTRLGRRWKKRFSRLSEALKRWLARMGWDRIPNRWFSPWIVTVARRPAAADGRPEGGRT